MKYNSNHCLPGECWFLSGSAPAPNDSPPHLDLCPVLHHHCLQFLHSEEQHVSVSGKSDHWYLWYTGHLFHYNTYFFSYLLPLGFVLDSTKANPFFILIVAGILVFFHQVFAGCLRLNKGSITAQLSRQLAALSSSMDESSIGDLSWSGTEIL